MNIHSLYIIIIEKTLNFIVQIPTQVGLLSKLRQKSE